MKGIIKLVAVLMLLISFSLGIVACADPSQDNFYSLKDAYEIGLLTREDLVEISTNYQASSPDRESELINDVGQEEYQKIKRMRFLLTLLRTSVRSQPTGYLDNLKQGSLHLACCHPQHSKC